MSSRLIITVFLIAAALSAQAQDAAPASEIGTKPLNLSLPRDVGWSATTRTPAAGKEARGNRDNGLPDLGSVAGQRGRMPYGSGYEARQRGMTGAGSGSQSGAGAGRRGMGMGRAR
jgi:hypothetical protein